MESNERVKLPSLTEVTTMIALRRGLFGLGGLILLLNLSVSAQSLADLARQEKEKRANDKSSRKVYTNDDLSQYEKLQPSAPANPTAESSVA